MATGEKAPDAFRTIGELSAELGVAQHILRYWETRFPQLKPMQRAGNRRYYRPEDVALVRRIHHLLTHEGYTVRGVQKLLRDKQAQAVEVAVAARVGRFELAQRGTFVPVADVELKRVTEQEQADYAAVARMYSESWRQMDPLVVAVKRYALDQEGGERVTIDGAIAPLDGSKYGWILSILGPPTREMITPAPGDVVSLQAAVRGGLLLPQIPPHHLFLGVQDLPPAGEVAPRGFLQTIQMLRGTPGYLGAWPKPGFLDLLPLGLGGSPPDEFGFSQLPLGLWKREGAGFSVLSFDSQLLADVTPALRVADATEPAQVRVHVGNLAESKLAGWINRTYYQRAAQASEGNVRFLHLLHRQLRVPMEDCLEVTEDLLDAELRCALGGKYELADVQGADEWRSTAVAGQSPPEDYVAPLLTWFRGLDASLIKRPTDVQAHLEIDMHRKPSEGIKLDELPLFNLFGGGKKAFKTEEKKEPAEDLPPPPLPPVPRDERPRRAEF